MYNAIDAKGGVDNGGMGYSIYFILLVVFGNCILSNMSGHACYCTSTDYNLANGALNVFVDQRAKLLFLTLQFMHLSCAYIFLNSIL